jgi:predicted dehydrogenase
MSKQQGIVNWGVLSTARIATKVSAAIREANGAELLAVGSRSKPRAAAWAAEHHASRIYGSYINVLEDDDVDAVYIPLPPSMHKEWTIKAAERGKHVLCEKPLAIDAAEAREMAAACRANGVQLMDGVMWVHHPRAADMHIPINDGALGELRRVTSAFTFNWDVVPEGDLRLSRDLGGGSLLDLGWYCIRATLWAFSDMPVRVYGTAKYYNDVDLSFSGTMWFDGDRIASFDCGFNNGLRKWLEVSGTRGSLVCDDFTKAWDADRPRFWVHDGSGKSQEHVSATPIQEVCMIEEFCRIVRSGQLDDRWSSTAIATQMVCDALDASARTRKPVDVNIEPGS